MQLRELFIENLNIPFKVSFQHSSADRAVTEAVLITAVTENGIQGIGEGCPRFYVTRETLETTHDFFNAHRSEFLSIGEFDELKYWVESHKVDIDKNPAAFCAVELALLDALAKEQFQSIEELLSLPKLSGKFRYTGVLGTSNLDNFQTMFEQYLQLGFSDFKVKVFGETEIDLANISAIKECDCNDIRVRLDANNLWSDSDEAIAYIKKLDYPFFGLEEPLAVHDYDGCNRIFEELETPIILDESIIREDDLEHIQERSETCICNIRVSKMGGILRSLAVAEKCKRLGIPIIIGAQVGETSILTRAALTIAHPYRNILLAQEGAFGTYLLEHDVIDPPIIFGKGGKLTAEQL